MPEVAYVLLFLLACFIFLVYARLSLCNSRSLAVPPSSLYSVEVTTLDGVDTEMVHFSGSAASGHHLLLLPGNPGSASFYLDFAASLSSASSGSLPITIVSHASHSSGCTGSAGAVPRYYDLAQQVRHKVSVAQALLQRHPQRRLILAGHSVGAHMCLEVMRALPDTAVARALLLFPTVLEIGASPNGVALMPLFLYCRWALAAAAVALGALPLAAQLAIARRFLPPAASPATASAALTIIHPVVGVNALYLALSEMRTIGALDEALARRLGEKCIAYFGAGDPWNRPGDHRLVQQAFGGQGKVLVCEEGHPHGFVVHPKSSHRVAEKCWEWCKDLL